MCGSVSWIEMKKTEAGERKERGGVERETERQTDRDSEYGDEMHCLHFLTIFYISCTPYFTVDHFREMLLLVLLSLYFEKSLAML